MNRLHTKNKRLSSQDKPKTNGVEVKKDNGPGVLTRLFNLGKAILSAPPPTFGDGLTNDEAMPKVHETGIVRDLISQGARIPEDFEVALLLLWSQTARGGLIDDKTYFVEKLMQLIASLPPTSKLQVQLTGTLIQKLWVTLQHPPLSFLGTGYKYRTADGSFNSIVNPNLGKAGTPYARSCTPKTLLHTDLPEPGVLFDTLFAREEFVPHPTGISSMLFYLATIIIHDAFKTDPQDPNLSNVSSYLDLAPLYGSNDKELQSVRLMSAGLLKPDTFCESRVLGFPPGVSVLLVCFNRFHNYAAEQLALINEGGRFPKPILPDNATDAQKKVHADALVKYDEELFQTARLITNGLYVNIVLNDYVKTILNFNRTDSTWTLDPRGTFDKLFDQSTGTPMGVGNQVSVEFNLIYRWHACVSERDAKWTEDFYNEKFGVDASKLTVEQLRTLLSDFGRSIPTDPSKRTFGGLERQSDLGGRFKDDDLARVLTESTEDLAGSFGAKNIPPVLRAVEMLGIEQARYWKVASLNEFRQFCGLEPHKTFEDINADPNVAQALQSFYNHPDLVELYAGLQAEEAKKPMVPGSGLCASYTISRAILSDAVALVRGDRFYTTDYSPANLTNWGFTTAASDPNLLQGRVIYKLLIRALPSYYRFNSVYAIQPFTVPSENESILKNLGTASDYDFSRPSFQAPPKVVTTHSACKQVLTDPKNFNVPWGPHIKELTDHGFMLGGDEPADTTQKKIALKYFAAKEAMDEVRIFWEETLEKLLKERSYQLENYFQVDVVRDIGNVTQARFTAELFYMPIKTTETPRGVFTEQEFYLMCAVSFAYVFLDADPGQSFMLRETARELEDQMTPIFEAVCKYVQTGEVLGHLKEWLRSRNPNTGLPSFGKQLIRHLLAEEDPYSGAKTPSPETVARAFEPILSAGSVQAQAFAQLLDVYLSDEYKSHWSDIQKLANDSSPEAFQKLRKYALEGMRLAPPASGVVRVVDAETIAIPDGNGKTVTMHRGDRLLVDFVTAANDSTVYPNPRNLDLNRPETDYLLYGYASHECLGKEMSITALTATLRVFGKLKNLRRAPGPQGRMNYVESPTLGPGRVYLKADTSSYWPFPTSMKIIFDEHSG